MSVLNIGESVLIASRVAKFVLPYVLEHAIVAYTAEKKSDFQ